MIANEGKIILVPTVIVLILGLVSSYVFFDNITWIKVFNYVVLIFLIFSLYFFREPNRTPIGESNEMVSPADGKIISIDEIQDPEVGDAYNIAIFLSVFNVHSQYVPINSSVISTNYYAGKYLMAFNPKTSEENEQSVTLFINEDKYKYKVKQIAGLIARRILNYMTHDQQVIKGDRLGFIRFGSRVEIIVSKDDFNVDVKKGDIVRANISKIGSFNV